IGCVDRVTDLYARLQSTAALIAEHTGRERHDVVVVLATGLGGYPTTLDGAVSVPHTELPGIPIPETMSHAGTAYSARLGNNRLLLLAGGAHAYEGRPMEAVTFPGRTAILTGARLGIRTNAAGGCGEGIDPGDLVLLTD